MSKPRLDYTLYLVTDRDLMSTPTLEEAVEEACEGGVTLVQVREKHVTRDEYTRIASGVKRVTDAHGVGLIVDDDPYVAAAVGADGVHVGQSDMALSQVREVVGEDAVVGVSASTLDEALAAEAGGADYLGIGAMTYTPTKPDAHVTTMEELARILDAVSIPCVVIGGVNANSVPRYKGFEKLSGYAVVSAIMAASDVEAASRVLRQVIGR